MMKTLAIIVNLHRQKMKTLAIIVNLHHQKMKQKLRYFSVNSYTSDFY